MCPSSPYTTKIRDKFVCHLKGKHKVSCNEYKKKTGSDTITHRVHLQCKLCPSRITHERCAVNVHASKKHSMSVMDYYNRQVEEEKETQEQGTDDTESVTSEAESVVTTASEAGSVAGSVLSVVSCDGGADSDIAAGEEEDGPGDKVHFCEACEEFSSPDLVEFAAHLRDEHKMEVRKKISSSKFSSQAKNPRKGIESW